MPGGKARIEKFALSWGPAPAGYGGTVHVGLVNNMPDAAMRATELQFARLLKDAAGALGGGRLDVRLHLFSLREIVRGEVAASRMEGFYADADSLPTAGLDALIVTGAEPHAADLRDEPYWNALSHLVDWAEIGTISTLFSCLAAHAAVLHLDNIARRPLPKKLSGVFAAERLGDEALMAGLPGLSQVPHSRRNEVPPSALAEKGYRILSRLSDGGADLFIRPGRSLFLFAQGHPEYGVETLGREYLRDIGRFLDGEATRPRVPENYFDRMTEDRLADLDASVTGPDGLPRYAAVVMEAVSPMSWRGPALKLFGNWLAFVAAEKMRRMARHHGQGRVQTRLRKRA